MRRKNESSRQTISYPNSHYRQRPQDGYCLCYGDNWRKQRCDKKSLFLLTHYIEIPLVIQGKRNRNICDVRLDYGAEVLEDYRVE